MRKLLFILILLLVIPCTSYTSEPEDLPSNIYDSAFVDILKSVLTTLKSRIGTGIGAGGGITTEGADEGVSADFANKFAELRREIETLKNQQSGAEETERLGARVTGLQEQAATYSQQLTGLKEGSAAKEKEIRDSIGDVRKASEDNKSSFDTHTQEYNTHVEDYGNLNARVDEIDGRVNDNKDDIEEFSNTLSQKISEAKDELNENMRSEFDSHDMRVKKYSDGIKSELNRIVADLELDMEKLKFANWNLYHLIELADNVPSFDCDTSIGKYSVAVGLGCGTGADYAVAMGFYCTATGHGSVAMGNICTASGISSSAVGKDNVASGDYANAFGYNNTASGDYSNAFGGSNTSGGDYSSVFGNNNTDNGSGSTLIIGKDNRINGNTYGYIIGNNNDVYNAASVCIGTLNDAYGTSSMSFGIANISSGTTSTAMGASCETDGYVAFAQGNAAKATADYARASGREITVSGEYSYGIALNDQDGAELSQANTMSIMGGNVGIGTLTPSTHLEVNGGIKCATATFTSGVLFNGDITISKADPKLTWTDTGDSNSAYATRSDTNGEFSIWNTAAILGSKVAINLDGTSGDKVLIPDGSQYSVGNTEDLTIAIWVKATAVDVLRNVFKWIKADSSRYLVLYQTSAGSGGWVWQYGTSAGADLIVSDNVPTIGLKTRLVGRRVSGVWTFHVNAVLQSDTDTLAGTIDVDQSIRIGINAPAEGFEFQGVIDQFVWWNVALTTTQITADYNSGNGSDDLPETANIVGLWKFSEGSGTNIEDFSQYGNDGTATMVGMTWTAEGGGIVQVAGTDVTTKVFESSDGTQVGFGNTVVVGTNIGETKLNGKEHYGLIAGTTKWMQDSTGFGIGTTAPETVFHVVGNQTIDGNIIADDASGGGYYDQTGTAGMTVNNGGNIDFSDGIDVTGNTTITGSLGVGTVSPTDDLEVHSAAFAGAYLTSDRNSDGDAVGGVYFEGENDAGTPEEISYASIVGAILDNADGSETGKLTLSSHNGYTIIADGYLGVLNTTPDVALDVNGFTQLGSNAPKIKMVYVSTTTAGVEGGTTEVLHGLTSSKILSVDVLVDTNNRIPPNFTSINEYEYDYFTDSNSVNIYLHATNSGSIINKAVGVLIIYIE